MGVLLLEVYEGADGWFSASEARHGRTAAVMWFVGKPGLDRRGHLGKGPERRVTKAAGPRRES